MADERRPACLFLSTLYERLSGTFSEPAAQKQLFSLFVLGVCASVLVVYLPSLSRQALMYDDQMYVTRNPLVQHPSWASARRFVTEIWRPSTVQGYYHPLAMISLMVDRFICGPHENMHVYHRTSLSLHVANTALLAAFLYLLFPHPFAAAAAALLFGLHPITVDSVCWLSERKTVLSTFFALWSLLAYVQFTRRRQVRFYVLCLVAYAFAMLSKPIALLLPLMMLLLDYWPLGRLHWRSLTEKAPLFCVTGVFAVVGYVSQLRSSRILLPGQYNPLEVPLLLSHNTMFYLGKLLWPVRLSPHYEAPESLISSPGIIACVLGTCVLGLLVALSLWRTRAVFMSGLIFLVMLLPASGIISHTMVIAANRYLYLPAIGLVLLPTWILTKLAAPSGQGGRGWCLWAITLAAAALPCAEAVVTREYLSHWSETRTLYEYMLSLYPRSGILHTDLAVALMAEGNEEDGLEHCRAALRGSPRSYRSYYNLAVALHNLGGHDDEAVRWYRRALQIKPSLVGAHMNLGLVLFHAGNHTEGLSSLRKATEIAPEFAAAQYNLGDLLVCAGQAEEGIMHLRQSIVLGPRFLLARKHLAWFLATHPDVEIRDANDAVNVAEEASAITKGRDARVLDVLAAAYASGGKYAKAVDIARKALAVATRLGASELAGQIEKRLHLYENKTPYREDPRERWKERIAKTKALDGTDEKTEEGHPDTESRRLEVHDEMGTISTE